MIECRCPSCNKLFRAQSSAFGEETTCTSCGHKWLLDVDTLAHFEFPSEIVVQLVDSLSAPIRESGVKIQAKRSFPLTDVVTDAEGCARMTYEQYERSWLEWTSWRLMDHPGDDSLARYITFWVQAPTAFGPERLDLKDAGENPIVMLKKLNT